MARGGATWKVKAVDPPSRTTITLNYGYLRCNVQIFKMGVEAIAKEEKVGADFAPPKNWAEAVAPRVQRPLPVDKTPIVEPVNIAEGQPPEQKKRRTQASPARQLPSLDAPEDIRFMQMEDRQARMEAQMNQLVELMQRMHANVGQQQPPPLHSLPATPTPQEVAPLAAAQQQEAVQQDTYVNLFGGVRVQGGSITLCPPCSRHISRRFDGEMAATK